MWGDEDGSSPWVGKGVSPLLSGKAFCTISDCVAFAFASSGEGIGRVIAGTTFCC